MHYIPDSTCEMLRGDPTATGRPEGSDFHYRSAPLYALTLVVAVLMILDWPAAPGSGIVVPAWWPRDLYGYRLALLAAVLGGARILYHALDGLLSGRIGADLALTVACLAAISLGEHHTAGLVVLISLIGESLEGYTLDRARWAVRQAYALQPRQAHLVHEGHERDVAIADVRVGDFLMVRPGERIPVDGRIVSGRTGIDQSAFTGESLPRDAGAGDRVFAGTLNLTGAVTVVAEQIGRSTALAHVADLVGSAAARKADVERTVDRLARWFLPAVLIAALATLVGWRLATGAWSRGVLPALGVLVVACPCPLVLATPAAVMAALAWLTRRGVIVRGSLALERLARVDTFAFDKTGTLTQGALQLGEVISCSNLSANAVLVAAASAERPSEHLLARVLVSAAQSRGLELSLPDTFEAVAGAGVSARVRLPGGDRVQTILVGNRRMLEYGEIAFHPDVADLLRSRELAGETAQVVAIDGQVVGVLGIRETIREESADVLRALQAEGVDQFALLTGDRPQPADAVVQALGVFDHVATEQLPADKARWVEASRAAGRTVAMVGDGVNDAPALAVADVGIALGRAGADLTAEAGDVILLGDPLRPLPGLLRLSKALVQNIWQSVLIFAFGMNGLGILACSLGWLSPVGAALFHEAASLAVMANAMRLLWFEGRADSLTARVQQRLFSAADWLVVAASPSQWIFWLLDRWRLSLKLLACGLAAAWLLSGLVMISEDEQALVTRFGRVQEAVSPGLHWRWPWPLERLVREPVGRIRAVGIGTRAIWTGVTDPGIVEWTSEHDDQDGAGSDESLMLTADEVPVELTASAEYRIEDLAQFAFGGTRQPEAVIRAAAESVLRETAARATLDELLTDRRLDLQQAALRRLRKRLEAYQLGIEIVDLQWLDVHPPKGVVPAYRQVADALEERDLLINEAQAYADRVVLAAIGESARARLGLTSDGALPTDAGTEDWRLDDAAWQALLDESESPTPVLSGTGAAILDEARVSAAQRIRAAQATAQRWEELRPQYRQAPGLTVQHLYWKTMAQALSGLSLTIVDPQAVGRQQVWMGDLPRLPVLNESDRQEPLPAPPSPATPPAQVP